MASRRDRRFLVLTERFTQFDFDFDRLVGNVGLLRALLFAEVDDAILAQDLEIVVHLTDVPVEPIGKGSDTLGWGIHEGSYHLEAAWRENALEATGVLEIDDVWHFFALLPAFSSV